MAELDERNKQQYELIVAMLKTHGTQRGCEYSLPYGVLRDHVTGHVTGIQALLKTMKRKNIITFVGDTFTNENLEIILLGEVDETAYTPQRSILQQVHNSKIQDYVRLTSGGRSGAC
eukprot:TRINITY_DN273_c0_g1_i1.p1 TRINITY_DN273_c0_g1~~TRINITY_DN273_c0_g1_i1.p1  ORF type:complete len:117 (-),score=55.36 TRINITY_DN273_c0_g1_i1:76-426(-)